MLRTSSPCRCLVASSEQYGLGRVVRRDREHASPLPFAYAYYQHQYKCPVLPCLSAPHSHSRSKDHPRSVVSLWPGPSNCSLFQTLPCRSVSSYPLLPFLSSVSAFLLPDLQNFAVLVELLHPAMVSVRHDVRSGRGVDKDRYLYFLSSFLS